MPDDAYLTPDERQSYKWLSNLDKVDDLLASHAVADDLLREAREALGAIYYWATNYRHSDPDVIDMLGMAGELLGRIDAVLNPEPARCSPDCEGPDTCVGCCPVVLNPEPAEPPTCPVHHGGIAGDCVCPEPASECARCRSWGAEPLTDGRSWQDCPDRNGTGKKEERA